MGTTTYTVTGTDDNGCVNTASIDILVNELPTVTASADDIEVCEGDMVTLTGDGAITYTWDGGAINATPHTPTLGTTTYTVTGTDDNGCENTASIDIIVYEAGCSGTETIVVSTQLGIAELNLNGATVFPNPTSDKLTIQLDGEFIYSLVSINGKILSTMKVTNQAQLNLSEYTDGVYFLEIESENGSEIVKVVKQ